MKKRTLINMLIVIVVAVFLWPAPDPLEGVESVALSTTDNSAVDFSSQILGGLEFALGKHQIRIVSDPNQADALLAIEAQNAQIDLNFDDEGFRGSATIRCLVKKNGQESVMFLHITVDENGVQAQLVGRKFWEIWK